MNAVLEFLRYDDPVDMTGQHFERQIASLFQILWIGEVRWRNIQVEEKRREEKLWGVDVGLPEHLTLFNLLKRENVRSGWCGMARQNAGFNKPLSLEDDDLPIHTDKFETDCDLSNLDYGIHFPSAKNHIGFDTFLKLKLLDGNDLLVLVEDKYTEGFVPFLFSFFLPLIYYLKKSGETYLKENDVAKKVCDTLKTYPYLVEALMDGRFCFILASFQNFPEDKSVEFVARLVQRELGKEEHGKRIYSFDHVDEITVELLNDCLIILRRDHLKLLLTPTLANRYHFLKSEKERKQQ